MQTKTMQQKLYFDFQYSTFSMTFSMLTDTALIRPFKPQGASSDVKKLPSKEAVKHLKHHEASRHHDEKTV
jgi:hypothetical protein